METQKKYKHKQTGLIAKFDGVSNYKVWDKNGEMSIIIAELIENTNDWEPIPESKMEVITVKDECVYYETNDILIKHPTQLMKQVVNQIEKGECYEKYSSQYGVSNNYTWQEIRDNENSCFNHKLLIIPIEESEANNG